MKPEKSSPTSNTADRTRAKAAKPAKSPKAPADSQAVPSQASEQTSTLAPETLARTLRAVAAELERDPALARRVAAAIEHAADSGRNGNAASSPPPAREDGEAHTRSAARVGSDAKRASTVRPRAFTPRLITGTSPELGTGVPDPFALYRRLGEDGLRGALAGLRLGSLRAIVREYTLDPSGRLAAQNDAERLRSAILEAATQGS
jgi:hypothetical protein